MRAVHSHQIVAELSSEALDVPGLIGLGLRDEGRAGPDRSDSSRDGLGAISIPCGAEVGSAHQYLPSLVWI